ncbi:unnamed protein product [Didymodactylos carnosus]|uniref:NmrA-like domain-containing protein n=1 Tax=Didymodactylos carnosus TaxID=1234261 RepID=A0A815HW69_9BILA|nr:unnamed protein product [Didymodactylos carnosus]CAF4233666.1 unnamed protein product [Didymodactylos carnosus]
MVAKHFRESSTGPRITVGNAAVGENSDKSFIEAALEAGVKWVIPTEFTADISHPFAAPLPIFASKIAVIKLLKENESRIAHTFITTGGFLDWGLDNGFLGFDITSRTATLYDDGKHAFSGTTLSSIGKAVVAVIHHPELTLNRRIYIADVTATQQQALDLFEKYTGTKWTVKHTSTEDEFKRGAELFAKGDFAQGAHGYLMAVAFNGQGACNFEGKTSNKALGIESISLEQIIKEAAERKKAAN